MALLLPLRRGEGDRERLVRYADPMLEDKEFLVREAIGWVLRETSMKDSKSVEKYFVTHLDRVSGLTLREGSKCLPEKARKPLRRLG